MGLDYPLIYTAFGDSLTVGTGAFFSPGFEKRYADLTERTLRRPVRINVIARNGATSGEVLQQVRSEKGIAGICDASIITIT
ncbi:MAG TPA: hypothetical protein VFK27_04590, partial [Bacillales bacterium]|nr:hypothetical protein [Bacillales bacterium]